MKIIHILYGSAPEAFLKLFKSDLILNVKDDIKRNQNFDVKAAIQKLAKINFEELLDDKQYKFKLWINELESNHNLLLASFLDALHMCDYKGRITIYYVGTKAKWWNEKTQLLSGAINIYYNISSRELIKQFLREPNYAAFPMTNKIYSEKILNWRHFKEMEIEDNEIYVYSIVDLHDFIYKVKKEEVFNRIKELFDKRYIKDVTQEQFNNYCFHTEPDYCFIPEYNFGMLSWEEYGQYIQEMVEKNIIQFVSRTNS